MKKGLFKLSLNLAGNANKNLVDLTDRILSASNYSVRIGYIEEKNQPRQSLDKTAEKTTNAEIARANEFGSPAENIPARPFLNPALEEIRTDILRSLNSALKKEADGQKGAYVRELGFSGMKIRDTAKSNIKNQKGFKPLSKKTLQERLKRGFSGTKALIVTGQLLNAIQYVIKKRK